MKTKKHKERECGWSRDKAKCDYAVWWDCSFLCSNKKINQIILYECKYKCPDFEKCQREKEKC
jgi:hypothetical protein